MPNVSGIFWKPSNVSSVTQAVEQGSVLRVTFSPHPEIGSLSKQSGRDQVGTKFGCLNLPEKSDPLLNSWLYLGQAIAPNLEISSFAR